jgi:phospholipid-transporting ATPase
VPFCAILSLTALKEIIEDFKRHKADRKVNHSEVEVLTSSGSVLKKWKDLCVGDIIKVRNEKYFPADLILLSSSEPAGTIINANAVTV